MPTSAQFIDNHTFLGEDHIYNYAPPDEKIAGKNGSIHESYMLPTVRIEMLKYPATSFGTSSEFKTDDYLSKVVDVTKLLAQLLNAKVVLEKLDEPSRPFTAVARAVSVRIKVELDDEKGETNCNNDFALRYCAKCKKSLFARIKDPQMKNCSDCKTAMTYLCTKCNVKYYKRYPYLTFHWKRCNGGETWLGRTKSNIKDKSADGYIDSKLIPEKAQFLVKQIQDVKMSEKIVRHCSECDAVIAVRQRARCHGKHLLYACANCNAKYSSYSSLMYHLGSQCYPSNRYQCTNCAYVTTSWTVMRKHFNNMHTDRPPFKCQFCTYETKYKFKLKRHGEKVHHDKVYVKFYCTRCNYSTSYKRSLQRHQNVHH